MERKIGLRELHFMASQMKYYDFENWIAKELFNQPETVNTREMTDKLFLHNVVGRSEQLKGDEQKSAELRSKNIGYGSKGEMVYIK